MILKLRVKQIVTNEKNKWVWFSRRDQQNLNTLPSAKRVSSIGGFTVSFLHFVVRVSFGLLVIGLLAFAGFAAVLATTGISNSYLTDLTREKLSAVAGKNIETKLGDSRLSVDQSGNLAFEGSDLNFKILGIFGENGSGTVGTVEMGMKAIALLSGKIDIGRIEVRDIDVVLPQMPAGDNGILQRFKRQDGLYVAGPAAVVVHDFVSNLIGQFRARGVTDLVVANADISGGPLAGFGHITIPAITISKNEFDEIKIKGEMSIGGQTVTINGQAIDNSQLSLNLTGFNFGSDVSEANVRQNIFHTSSSFQLETGIQNGKKSVIISALLPDFVGVTKHNVRLAGVISTKFQLLEGVEKIEILPSRFDFGKNSTVVTGAIAPTTPVQGNAGGSYRFEVVSDHGELMPVDSPESKLTYALRVAGDIKPQTATIQFGQISVRTLSGEVEGQGSLRFAGGSPESIFSFQIPKIDVKDAKQLWPSIFGSGARHWVLDHVYGGTLEDSVINVAFRAGYFTNPANSLLPLDAEELNADFDIRDSRFDLIGELPPVRAANGHVAVRGSNTEVKLESGVAYLEDGRSLSVSNGQMSIPTVPGHPVIADLDIDIVGDAGAIAEVANREPLHALTKAPVRAGDLHGHAVASITARFPLSKAHSEIATSWKAQVKFENLDVDKPFNGQTLTDATGTLDLTKETATLKANGLLNGTKAEISVSQSLDGRSTAQQISAKLMLDDKARAALFPGLSALLKGPVSVEYSTDKSGARTISADLKSATINLPWIGWSKGKGIGATVSFAMDRGDDQTKIRDFKLEGDSFNFAGDINLSGSKFVSADFSRISLGGNDVAAVTINHGKSGYDVTIKAKSLDMRGVLKRLTGSFESTAAAAGTEPIHIRAGISNAVGFNDVVLQNVNAEYSGRGAKVTSFVATATTQNGAAIAIQNKSADNGKVVKIESEDGGSILRFLDIYDKMRGGQINITLTTNGNGPLQGEIDARNFDVVGEPRLKAIVGAPANDNGRALSTDLKKKIDVSKVRFQRGYAVIEKGKGYLKLGKGILRSDQVGLSYNGTLYDAAGRIDMNGTFLPAYGINRLFGEIPLVGELLGNGRDKGLIGITFNLSGNAKSPTLNVNPISLIAPGIFRQIFEFQ